MGQEGSSTSSTLIYSQPHFLHINVLRERELEIWASFIALGPGSGRGDGFNGPSLLISN